MNENTNTPTLTPTFYRPSLSFFHASPRGTGCALMLELRPAFGTMEGCVMMTMANQLTIGDRRGPNPVHPTFDMENRMTVKLGFTDITKMLQVFRGECESIDGDKGLYHRTAKFTTKILLRHFVEPTCGYALDVFRNGEGSEDRHAGIVLSSAEALGLALAIENSFGVLCFGIPMVTDYERRQDRVQRPVATKPQEVRDARAA